MGTSRDLPIRPSTFASFESRFTWSSISDHSRRTTQGPNCSINRYYDPTTYSFISVDLALRITNQPYVFTNDSPLNAADPLGMMCVGFNDAICPTATIRTVENGVSVFSSITRPAAGLTSVSLTTSPVTVTFLGVTVTVSVSATITYSGQQKTPTLNVSSDGTYGVTANGKTVGSSASGGIFTSASLPTGSASFNLGGDHVTTDVSVSVSNSQSSGGLSWGDVVDFFVAPVTAIGTVAGVVAGTGWFIVRQFFSNPGEYA